MHTPAVCVAEGHPVPSGAPEEQTTEINVSSSPHATVFSPVTTRNAGAAVPASPFGAGATGGPGGPAGPAGPCAPASPFGPGEPAGPSGPTSPFGPSGPTAPTGPGEPAGPCGPAAPAWPCGPGAPGFCSQAASTRLNSAIVKTPPHRILPQLAQYDQLYCAMPSTASPCVSTLRARLPDFSLSG